MGTFQTIVLAIWIVGAGWHTAGAQQTPTVASPSFAPQFDFHSGFWVNLDSFLYEEALPSYQRSKRPLTIKLLSSATLSPSDRAIWNEALVFYRNNRVGHERDDPASENLIEALAQSEESLQLQSTLADPALTRMLNLAAPIYRKYWWESHNAANRFWMAALSPILGVLADRIGSRLTAAYQAPWPKDKIRVEVTVYGNWFGAFTWSNRTGYIVMPSTDPNYQGFSALEMIFHEASHTIVFPDRGSIGELFIAAGQASGVKVPKDLWHVLIFYTTGQVSKQAFAEVGINYESLNDRAGLWNGDGPWRQLHEILDLYWKAYLDGRLSIKEAAAFMLKPGVAALLQ